MIYNFYHVTDVHYYSKKNFDYDYTKVPQPSTEICIMASEESFKKALEIIGNDKDTDTVIITGDLTNHGEKYSHDEMLSLLSDFTAKGGNPFVVTDSHDYPDFDVYNLDEKGNKIPATHMERDEVVPMYYPFGRDKAFDIYSGDDTTYIAEILPNLYYIALGYDYMDNINNHHPDFSDELMAWVKDHAEKAAAKGATVICGTHRPIVTPSPAYAILGNGNTFINGEKRIREFADMGIKLFFSGHTHIQSLKEITSDKGNKIYSVQTSSLAGFPPKMRKITIDTDKGEINIRTIDMDLPEMNLGMTFTEYARKGFLGIVENIPYNMEHDIEAFINTDGGVNLPEDLIRKYPKVVMFIGRKINGLTYEKVAKFSKKYHRMNENEYAAVKDKKFVSLVFDLVGNLYKGNGSYTPDTAEYKIMTGLTDKIEKLASALHINLKKLLSGYTLREFIEPLLYNSGLDVDNVSIKVDFK